MRTSEPLHGNERVKLRVLYFMGPIVAFLILVAWDPAWKSEGEVTGVVVGNIQQVTEFVRSEEKVQISLGDPEIIVAKTGKHLGYPHVVGSQIRVVRSRSLIFGKLSYQVSPQ